MNHQEHGQSQEGSTVGVWRTEEKQDVYSHADGGEALSGVGARVGGQSLTLDREIGTEGIGDFDPFGGVIDQLIDDARKQWVKSQECIVWYRSEAEEYKQKLDNLIKLKELQQQQQQEMRRWQEAQRQQQQTQSSTTNGGENLAE
ncbi:hypothetical protein D0A34_09670 [Microcoleus vaginatus PCC 9802]|uniref:hypothetical protein n=1 Tax=Microcoleus vaginatus TaxID=119532 RepID=UPI00020D1D90|nr:hypothetical protein MicvaDRAFT_0040 [Microcoleus vaginatus FGP-2]UNU19103.1 hypothetical protein D0A34_09670 [Microcoleus vaginatus PCC 9802]